MSERAKSDEHGAHVAELGLLIALAASGCASLGYEILWTRLLGLSLGSEPLGVLSVLGGFLLGMAIGAWLLHDPIVRARRPLRLFAGLELGAALYAVASPLLLYALAERLPPGVSIALAARNDAPTLAVTVVLATVVLLPGTVCLGATLAAAVEALRRTRPTMPPGRNVGRLLAINTLGATLGVLVTIYWLLPRLGFVGAALALAAMGIVAAAIAVVLDRRLGQLPAPAARETGAETEHARTTLALLWLAGLCGIGFKIAAVQTLAPATAGTVFTFANVLCTFLLGSAAGAWLYQRHAPRSPGAEPGMVTTALFFALALAIGGAMFVLRAAPAMLAAVAPPGSPMWRAVAAELITALAVVGPATIVMGALSAHLLGLIAPRGIGRAYALNTLGAAIAPLVFGLVAIPLLGYAGTLMLALLLYAIGFVWCAWRARVPAAVLGGGATAIVVLVWAAPSTLALVGTAPGWKVIARSESLLGLVTVSQALSEEEVRAEAVAAGLIDSLEAAAQPPSAAPAAPPLRRLQIGNTLRMGGGLSFGEQRMGHLPLLLAPEARSMLFIGVGTGATLGACRFYPLETIDAVELIPEILDLLPLFDSVNHSIGLDPRISFYAADARRFVASAPTTYDLIVADLFHPGRDGGGSLYTIEHFHNVRRRLAPGGLFAQWVPLYQFDMPTLQTMLRAFLAVFPEAHSFLGLFNAETPPLLLLGRVPTANDELAIDLDRLRSTMEAPGYEGLLLDNAEEFLASYMLDRDALVEVAGEGPAHTDLRPRLDFAAPRLVYEPPPDLQYGTLAALLPRRTGLPRRLLDSSNVMNLLHAHESIRCRAAALALYLEGDIERIQRGDVTEATIAHSLESLERCPDFRPARTLLYAMFELRPAFADRMFERMVAIDPLDERVFRIYLSHLAVTGQAERYQQILAEGQARFGSFER